MTVPLWRPRAPRRDITIYSGEDVDLAVQLVRAGQPWTPPSGTRAFFRTWIDSVAKDFECTLVDGLASVHIEAAVLATVPQSAPWWFFIQTPETDSGNPHVVTTGRVNRVDPS